MLIDLTTPEARAIVEHYARLRGRIPRELDTAAAKIAAAIEVNETRFDVTPDGRAALDAVAAGDEG